jgi:hypothetical protein
LGGLVEVAQAERRQAEISAKLNQMLARSFLSFRVFRPVDRVDSQLVRIHCNTGAVTTLSTPKPWSGYRNKPLCTAKPRRFELPRH